MTGRPNWLKKIDTHDLFKGWFNEPTQKTTPGTAPTGLSSPSPLSPRQTSQGGQGGTTFSERPRSDAPRRSVDDGVVRNLASLLKTSSSTNWRDALPDVGLPQGAGTMIDQIGLGSRNQLEGDFTGRDEERLKQWHDRLSSAERSVRRREIEAQPAEKAAIATAATSAREEIGSLRTKLQQKEKAFGWRTTLGKVCITPC